jgi:hypothetical protein
MILFIEPETTLQSLQNAFHQVYPFLTIRFYKSSVKESGIKDRLWIDDKMRLKDISKRSNLHGVIELHYWDKVNSVEQIFQRVIGLGVQVFRKHGLDWIDTTGSDTLTLEEQNEIGMESSKALLNGIMY